MVHVDLDLRLRQRKSLEKTSTGLRAGLSVSRQLAEFWWEWGLGRVFVGLGKASTVEK